MTAFDQMAQRSTGPQLNGIEDVVATVGGLNLDINIEARTPDSLLDHFEKAGRRIVLFEENRIEEEDWPLVNTAVKNLSKSEALGGAGFHAARGINRIGHGVGILPIGAVSAQSRHLEYFQMHGIDTRWITSVALPVATSFVFRHDGGRTLLTTCGSNRGISEVLAKVLPAVLEKNNSVSLIHASTFLDAQSQNSLRSFLRKVSKSSNRIPISFDPGSDWSDDTMQTILEILEVSSILHLNEIGLRRLGGKLSGESDCSVVERLLEMLRPGWRHLFLRRSDSVSVFSGRDRHTISQTDLPLVGLDAIANDSVGQTLEPGDGQFLSGLLMARMASPRLAFAQAAELATKQFNASKAASQ